MSRSPRSRGSGEAMRVLVAHSTSHRPVCGSHCFCVGQVHVGLEGTGVMAENGSHHGKIAVLLANGFEDVELEAPCARLRAAGFQVEVVGSARGETLTGKRGRVTVTADLGIDDADPGVYEGMLIPGGYSPDALRADRRFVELVQAFDSTGRPLAAVCHGPQLLLTAELVRGRRLTAWPTVQGDLRQAGAEVDDQPVVVDDNWITSGTSEDLEAFSAKLIERLRDLEARGRWQDAHADPQMV
jgi:protease I